MTGDLRVRPIEEVDWEAVTALLEELGNPARTPATEDAMRAVFLRHLHAPDTASLLIERNSTAIGVLTMHVRERLNRLIPEAWVPNFVVTERERGTGAAQMLFRHSCDVARARGCYRIVLESNYALLRGHRFYAREGMNDAG
jgi:GNAT superfamily N-acetyltransferase